MDSDSVLMAVGSWHEELGGAGSDAGIRIFEIPREGEPALVRRIVPEAAVGSMSWAEGVLLVVDERKGLPDGEVGGRLIALDPTADAGDALTEVPTLGAFPCSLARHPGGTFVAVANYGSEDFVTRAGRGADGSLIVRREYDHGSVVVTALDAQGRPSPVVDLVVHDTAAGADRTWQLAGHPHSVAWSADGRYLAVADRGADAVTVYELVPTAPRLEVASVLGFPRGEGPRTLCFDPAGDRLFVADELRASVAALDFDHARGTLSWGTLASTDPPGYEPADPDDFFALTHPSAVVVDEAGANLYVLNRGPDTITWFDIRDGVLVQQDVVSSVGSGPWGAGRHGDRLWIAHRVSGEVVEFDISRGQPRPTGRVVKAPGAVSVAFDAA